MNKTIDPTSHKVSRGRLKKESIVAKLSDKVSRASALVFTDYQGLTHKQIEELKKTSKALNAEFVVAKNSLLKLALGKKSEIKNQELEGPTATLFIYEDFIQPLQQLAKIIKQYTLPKVKFGILNEKFYDSDQILRIASLPSREVLIAQLVWTLKSPIYGLHRALNWNLQKLMFTLKIIEEVKGKNG